MAESVLLFSYGTLQLKSVQLANFDRELKGQPDAMVGWHRAMVEITDPDVLRQSGATHHPIVSPSGNLDDEVPGVVFEMTPDELIAADGYEVADYKRILVTLRSGAEAWVYVKA
jgi:hypothetical protein